MLEQEARYQGSIQDAYSHSIIKNSVKKL